MTELAPQEYPRRIMTFMRRSSAFTVSQQKGIDEYGEYYFLEPQHQVFDPQTVFGRGMATMPRAELYSKIGRAHV